VLVRRLMAALPVVILLVAGCGGGGSKQDDSAKAIAGDWTGTLRQKGLAPFRIAVHVEASGEGRVAYTGIECGGGWNLRVVRYTRPEQYEFAERITEGVGGKCKGSGAVSVQRQSSAADSPLRYEFTGGGVTSRGLLHGTDAAGLQPIFGQAGVDPPD
jgi:hypothetical protein